MFGVSVSVSLAVDNVGTRVRLEKVRLLQETGKKDRCLPNGRIREVKG